MSKTKEERIEEFCTIYDGVDLDFFCDSTEIIEGATRVPPEQLAEWILNNRNFVEDLIKE